MRVNFRNPTAADGAVIWRFVEEAGMLRKDPAFSYMLFCQHFSETSIIAEYKGTLDGFAAAYCPPRQPDTIFVWQVGVAHAVYGHDLGVQLLEQIIARPACRDARFLETGVTVNNDVTRAIFCALAHKLNAACIVQPLFDKAIYPELHATRVRFCIGPFEPNDVT